MDFQKFTIHLQSFVSHMKLPKDTSTFHAAFKVYSATAEANEYSACSSQDEVNKHIEGCRS